MIRTGKPTPIYLKQAMQYNPCTQVTKLPCNWNCAPVYYVYLVGCIENTNESSELNRKGRIDSCVENCTYLTIAHRGFSHPRRYDEHDRKFV